MGFDAVRMTMKCKVRVEGRDHTHTSMKRKETRHDTHTILLKGLADDDVNDDEVFRRQ